jgi:hypothetical protein
MALFSTDLSLYCALNIERTFTIHLILSFPYDSVGSSVTFCLQSSFEKCLSRTTTKVSSTGFDGKCQFVPWSSLSQLWRPWNLSKNWKLSLWITLTCGIHAGETSILSGFLFIELSLSFACLGCYTKSFSWLKLMPSISTPSKIIPFTYGYWDQRI